MKLTIKKREEQKKSGLNAIRRQGGIPAILYAKHTGKDSDKNTGEPIEISSVELDAQLRGLKSGHLPTTIFTLEDGKKQRRALIKDLQRNIITYQVSHIDFEELVDEVPISLKVPVTLVGLADCVGVKLGGIIRQV